MNDERFMNHYVKVANATISESILRNVNLQANANFVDELIGELNAENESLRKQVQEISENYNTILAQKEDVDSVRHQLNHLETFRDQLMEAQKLIEAKDVEIEKLKKEIENLQSPPVTKRKKVGVLSTPVEVENTPMDTLIKDGGIF